MTSPEEARYGALVEFIGTFTTLSGLPPTDLAELSDGVVLFEALSEIAPDYFDPSTIARHLGDNWALKSSNWRKLLRNLETYYHEVLQKDAAEFGVLQTRINALARQADRAAIASTVELVAAAAVTCEHRSTFVARIMSLATVVEMKGILEQSLARLEEYSNDREEEEDNDDDEYDEGGDEKEMVFDDDRKDGLFGAGHLSQHSMSDEQKEELERALADARRELAACKSQAAIMSEDHEAAQKKLRALVEDLQDRLVKRQAELIEAEEELQKTTSEMEDYRAKAMDLEQAKAQLADDLDVAHAKVEQLHKAEATVVAYRKKLEGVGVLNQQMTDLEDQAASYLRQIMDLENDVKRLPTLQKNVEELQSKIAQLERENASTESSLKASATEVAELKNKLSASDSAKKMYEEELRELKAQHDHGVHVVDDELGGAMGGLTLTSADSVSEAREKALRMEIENKKLREELEQLKSSKLVASVTVATSDGDVGELQAELARVKELLAQKEAEKDKIGSDKDKLEAYTKRTLAKFQEKYLVALQECKAKLKEKQDKIEALEGRNSAEKTAQKREERLLSSTIYELGLTIMQNRLRER